LGGLSIFAGEPLANEGISPVDSLKSAQLVHGKNRYFLTPSSSLFLCWQSGFLSWLEQWQPEVLIAEANPRYPTTRRAIAWMRHKGRKVIGWGLGAPEITGPLAGLRKKERLSLWRTLDAIIAYSQVGAEQYRQQGFSAERVYVAFNAVEPASIVRPPERPRQYSGRATILFIGRLQARKRVDMLIKASAALPPELQPNVVIVGDGPVRTELEHLAGEYYPQTEFVGAKQGADLEPYLSKADLFVLPGTGGLAIQQAMAHGLPVIVAQGDGTQDDLVRTENGWQVLPDDVQALTGLLKQALSDPARLRKMGNASFRIVADEINIDKMAEEFIRALNDVCK
jgi:glycosyltransferase involved in cell wall biosynthesis